MALVMILIMITLRATAHVSQILPSLGLYTMTYGGIGVITVGMMARVSIGHTGRNVAEPLVGISVIFMLMVAGAVIRSLLPIWMMEYYFLLILISQIFWLGAFMLMLVYFLPTLTQARADGRYS